MLVEFDVDCGELVAGHRFIARGLGGPSLLPVPDYLDGDSAGPERTPRSATGDGYPGFSLEYELVPGVSGAEGKGKTFFHFLVSIAYRADVELPWEPHDGGAIAPFDGGDATHGSRGDWPLPPGATVLTFSMAGPDQQGFADAEHPAGELVVDLVRGKAAWHPA
jgi:hypothetical protein